MSQHLVRDPIGSGRLLQLQELDLADEFLHFKGAATAVPFVTVTLPAALPGWVGELLFDVAVDVPLSDLPGDVSIRPHKRISLVAVGDEEAAGFLHGLPISVLVVGRPVPLLQELGDTTQAGRLVQRR